MAGVNRAILIGHLGKDPEVKSLQSGKKVANVSLATSESYKNQAGEKVEETTWHNLVIWGNQAEFVGKYLKKGEKVFVEGKIKNRSYDAQDGTKKYVSEIWVTEIQSLTPRATGTTASQGQQSQQRQPAQQGGQSAEKLPWED